MKYSALNMKRWYCPFAGGPPEGHASGHVRVDSQVCTTRAAHPPQQPRKAKRSQHQRKAIKKRRNEELANTPSTFHPAGNGMAGTARFLTTAPSIPSFCDENGSLSRDAITRFAHETRAQATAECRRTDQMARSMLNRQRVANQEKEDENAWLKQCRQMHCWQD